MILFSFYLFATPHTAFSKENKRDSIPSKVYTGYPSYFSLGVHAGTTGLGVHIAKSLNNKFGTRLGVSFMPFKTSIKGAYSGRDTESDLNAKANNVSVMLDYKPFATKSGFFRSFNVQIGAAYFFKLDGVIKTQLADPYRYGGLVVPPEDLGTITTRVNWKEAVTPYVGIGWNHIVIDNNFSMQADLGCYYLSEPTVTMEATGFLIDNVSNRGLIEENVKNYRYLPRLEIGISYRIL
jgi:hypothetical protein